MNSASSKPLPGLLKWAGAALIGTFLGYLVRQSVPNAGANDYTYDNFGGVVHLSNMNASDNYEIWCVWPFDNTMGWDFAKMTIGDTLWKRPPLPYAGYLWEDVYGVDFYHLNRPCPDGPGAERPSSAIYFYTQANIDWSLCGPGFNGCATATRRFFDPRSGHHEYGTFEVDLRTGALYQEDWQFNDLVNHEVGHVMGLYDGAQNSCNPPSFMHPHPDPGIGECTDGPSGWDLLSIRNHLPGGSSGFGNIQGKSW